MADEFRLPDIGEGLADAEIVRWHVAVGDTVRVGEVLVEVETAKAVVEIPSPFAGTVLRLGAPEGATVNVGEVLVVVGEPGEEAAEAGTPRAASTAAASAESAVTPGETRAMPVVRRLAREHGVDLADVTGTGPGGSITRVDVAVFLSSRPGDVEAAAAVSGRPADVERAIAGSEASTGAPAPARADDDRMPLSRLRRTIAEHMARSWREIPHVTAFAHADATRLLEWRAAARRDRDRSVPVEALLMAALVPLLREHPEVNATLDGDALILHRRYDVGFAVDTPEGLTVAVVRGVDHLDLDALADEVDRLAEAVRSRTATPDEVAGATFTLSNIGALGGGLGTPIIPFGTTAILAVGAAAPTPVVRDGEVVVVELMPLSLSYDHRVIDGGAGQRFLAAVVERIESPGG
jgi:pyruvate dehydrogenase E2 component (dihydrolipoamide acetyltransferase)